MVSSLGILKKLFIRPFLTPSCRRRSIQRLLRLVAEGLCPFPLAPPSLPLSRRQLLSRLRRLLLLHVRRETPPVAHLEAGRAARKRNDSFFRLRRHCLVWAGDFTSSPTFGGRLFSLPLSSRRFWRDIAYRSFIRRLFPILPISHTPPSATLPTFRSSTRR